MNSLSLNNTSPLKETNGELETVLIPPTSIAEKEKSLPDQAELLTVIREINSEKDAGTKGRDYAIIFFRTLSFLGGVGVGVLTGLVIIGVAATPVGWGILGAALIIGVIGCAYYGGLKEFIEALKLAGVGFLNGMGITLLIGLPYVIPPEVSYADIAMPPLVVTSLIDFMAITDQVDAAMNERPILRMSPETEKEIYANIRSLYNQCFG